MSSSKPQAASAARTLPTTSRQRLQPRKKKNMLTQNKNRATTLVSAAGALAMLATGAFSSSALASSHREAPSISLDPAADNTDLYAWVKPGTHDKLYIVAAYNPLEEPSGGPNFHKFDDNVRYEIHIARGGDSLRDEYTYYIYFKTKRLTRLRGDDIANSEELFNGIQFFRQISSVPPQQTYTVVRKDRHGKREVIVRDAPVAPPNIGPSTDRIVYQPASGVYDDAYAASFLRNTADGGRVWAGPRDDGFYVDLGGIFDLANILPNNRAKPVDGVAGFNCHAIVLEIPTETLTASGEAPTVGASDEQTLGIWASASRRKVTVRRHKRVRHYGRWVQVSRLGLPLINEVVIGLQDKDKFNRSRPKNDARNFGAYFLNPVLVRNAEAVGIYAALGFTDSAADTALLNELKHGPDGNGRLDIINAINIKDVGGVDAHSISTIGDVLRVDMGLDSAFPNGRPLVDGAAANQEQADVTDVLLTLLLSGGRIAVSDNVSSNDKDFLTEMPFLALPWQGFDQGHGIAAP